MRLRTRLLAVSATLAALCSFTPSANATGIPQGPYEIFTDHHATHMCLDVPYGDKNNGVKIQQYGCWGGKMQLWYAEFTAYGPWGELAYYRWRNAATGKCLDVPYGDPANGVQLQQWDCWADGDAGQMQQWQDVQVDATHSVIRNRQTRKCIDVPYDNPNPVTVQQWDCWNGPMQLWREDWP